MFQLIEDGPHRRIPARYRRGFDLLFRRFRRRSGSCCLLRSGFLRLNVGFCFSLRWFHQLGRFRSWYIDMWFVDRQIFRFEAGRLAGVEIHPFVVQRRNGDHASVRWTVDAGEPRVRIMPGRRHEFDDFPSRLMFVDFAEQVADSDRLESYESAHHKWLAVALPQLACAFSPRSTQSTQNRTHMPNCQTRGS